MFETKLDAMVRDRVEQIVNAMLDAEIDEHRVEDLRPLLGDQPVEPGLEQVLVDLYDVRGSWFRLLASNRGFLFWRMKIVHRTRAMPSYVRAGIRKCARIRALGAADIFLEIITQPFLGFDGIVPGSSNQATV